MGAIAMYLRLSLSDYDLGDNGKDESNSIENQRLFIRTFITKCADELFGDIVEYVDDGYTGTNFNRPGFKQMVEDAKSGKISTIIVKDLSRLGRDYIGVGDYLEQIFPALHVRVIAIASRYDSNDHIGDVPSIDVGIDNMINNMYSKDLSRKVKSAIRAKWDSGYDTGGMAPFGYKYVGKGSERKLVLNEDTAPIVRLIFEKAMKGWKGNQIAGLLNQEKKITPSAYLAKNNIRVSKLASENSYWTRAAVFRIIRDYNYTGNRVHGMHNSIGFGKVRQKKETNKAKWTILENNHEAIVTIDEFETAQLSIPKRKVPTSFNKNKTPLDKKFRCGCCGMAMTLQYYSDTEKYFYCRRGPDSGYAVHCNETYYDANMLETRVLSLLNQYMMLMGNLCEQIKNKKSQVFPDVRETLHRLEEELEQKRNEFLRQYENYTNGAINRDEFLLIKGKINQEKEEISHKIESIENQNNETDDLLLELDRLQRQSFRFKDRKALTDEVVDTFIEKVLIHDEKNIEVHFRFEDLFFKLCDQAAEFKKQRNNKK